MTSLDGINGRSIQTLLRGENDSKQSDEFQATAITVRHVLLSFITCSDELFRVPRVFCYLLSLLEFFVWCQGNDYRSRSKPPSAAGLIASIKGRLSFYYFGGARSKGFATLRNVSKLPFFDKIGHAKSVDFRFYSAI